MVSGAVNRYSKEMGEDKLRLLMWKGSLTSRTRRTLVVLLVMFFFLIFYQYSRHSHERWTTHSKSNAPHTQFGTQAELHDEQARIAKISILYGNPSRAYERALQTHKRHNRKHGYPMFIQRVDVLDGYWTKPAFLHYMILRELRKPESERLQWLFWFDADTVVVNYNIAMEDFLPPDQDEVLGKINILVADDWNGLNNGVFGIRVSRYAAELFAGILAFRDFEPDTPLPFQDQSAMEYMLKRRKFINHVAKVPQRWFNAYESEEENPPQDRIHPGDFLVHFAGVGEREKHLMKWSERSDQMSPKWNVPLIETDYPQELERYWNRTKALHVARVTQWNNGKTHLEAFMKKVNETVYEYINTPEVSTEPFQAVTRSYVYAEQFLFNTTRWGEEAITKEDLHELSKVVLDLQDTSSKFTEGIAKTKEAKLAKEKEKEAAKKDKEEAAKKDKEEAAKKEEEAAADKKKPSVSTAKETATTAKTDGAKEEVEREADDVDTKKSQEASSDHASKTEDEDSKNETTEEMDEAEDKDQHHKTEQERAQSEKENEKEEVETAEEVEKQKQQQQEEQEELEELTKQKADAVQKLAED